MIGLALVAVLAGCTLPSEDTTEVAPAQPADRKEKVVHHAPERFTIVPDDHHVPYAGTAEDGRKFFLSEELFSSESGYVGLFLWNADGTFDEVRVDDVSRPTGLPPGQAAPAGADALVDARLAELGKYVLEPIEVEPFTEKIDGVTFGWKVGQYDDSSYYINIEPGNFIAYYEPWDGLGYDT